MGYYKTMEPEDKALEEFPGLSWEELDAADRMFTPYLFFQPEKEGRRIWTTCCRREEVLPKIARTETPEIFEARTTRQGGWVTCPFCKRKAKVYARSRMKHWDALREYHPILYLHVSEDGQTVWVQGYWTTRNWYDDPLGETLFACTRVYRFRPGEAVQWDSYNNRMEQVSSRKWIQEPFVTAGMYGGYESYKVEGIRNLRKSFLKYAMADIPLTKEENDLWTYTRKRKDLCRYLGMAAKHPENVEMLRKAGVIEPLVDWIHRKRKNADVLKWGQKDPRKAFRLTKQELKAFLETKHRAMNTLRMYQKSEKRLTFAQCEELLVMTRGKNAMEFLDTAARFQVPADKLYRYLDGFTGPRCHGQAVTLEFVMGIWKDYIRAAEALGYDLSNPLIQMPRDLDRKHDEVTRNWQVLLDQEAAAKAEELFAKLQVKYGFEGDGYFIRAPYTPEEIAEEGKALCHCVGGYAKRHIEGKTTILFLRNVGAPATPYVTIEMHGTELAQIHGYKNDVYGPSPMKTHKELIDRWLAWVKAGSKRDKEGRPRLPKKKEDAA